MAQKFSRFPGKSVPKNPGLRPNYPDFINTDINRSRMQLEQGRTSGLGVDPSLFEGGFLHKSQAPIALQELLREDLGAAPILNRTNVRTQQPQAPTYQAPISDKLPDTAKIPKVKIEAPMQDLADLIHDSIAPPEDDNFGSNYGQSQSEETNQFDKLPTYQAPISEDLPRTEITPNYFSQQEPSIYDRLKEQLTNVPTREGNKPSKWRKIGAAVAGGLVGAAHGPEAGYKLSSGIVDAPYEESYQDWLNKTGALEKQVNLDLAIQKAETAGMSDLASLLRAQNAGDPELQGRIAGEQERAREGAREPNREKSRDAEFTTKLILDDLATNRAVLLEQMRQTGRTKEIDAQIKSRERIAREQIFSANNRAKLARDLKERMASEQNKNQRIPPSQQYLAGIIAEAEVAKSIADPEVYNALFKESKDSQGRPVIVLKSLNEVLKNNPELVDIDLKDKGYYAVKKDIDKLIKEITKISFNPRVQIDEEDDEDYDYLVIEEVD